MVQLSATRCSFVPILWVSPVSFATITLCIASQLVFIVYFVIDSVRKLLDTPSYKWIKNFRLVCLWRVPPFWCIRLILLRRDAFFLLPWSWVNRMCVAGFRLIILWSNHNICAAPHRSDWGLSGLLTTPHHKVHLLTKCYAGTRTWPMEGSCEHGNEPWGLMKGEEFLEQLLRKNSAAWSLLIAPSFVWCCNLFFVQAKKTTIVNFHYEKPHTRAFFQRIKITFVWTRGPPKSGNACYYSIQNL
jgi:hypothetical protein